jgi:hypothetical protein
MSTPNHSHTRHFPCPAFYGQGATIDAYHFQPASLPRRTSHVRRMGNSEPMRRSERAHGWITRYGLASSLARLHHCILALIAVNSRSLLKKAAARPTEPKLRRAERGDGLCLGCPCPVTSLLSPTRAQPRCCGRHDRAARCCAARVNQYVRRRQKCRSTSRLSGSFTSSWFSRRDSRRRRANGRLGQRGWFRPICTDPTAPRTRLDF